MDDTVRPDVLKDYAATISEEVDQYVDDWYRAMRREYGLGDDPPADETFSEDEKRDERGRWTSDGDHDDDAATDEPPDPGADQHDDHEALKTLKGLYRNALASDFDHKETEAKITEIAKSLKAAELRGIADKWGIVLPANASKGAIAEAMTRRIFERRAFHLRTRINADESL